MFGHRGLIGNIKDRHIPTLQMRWPRFKKNPNKLIRCQRQDRGSWQPRPSTGNCRVSPSPSEHWKPLHCSVGQGLLVAPRIQMICWNTCGLTKNKCRTLIRLLYWYWGAGGVGHKISPKCNEGRVEGTYLESHFPPRASENMRFQKSLPIQHLSPDFVFWRSFPPVHPTRMQVPFRVQHSSPDYWAITHSRASRSRKSPGWVGAFDREQWKGKANPVLGSTEHRLEAEKDTKRVRGQSGKRMERGREPRANQENPAAGIVGRPSATSCHSRHRWSSLPAVVAVTPLLQHRSLVPEALPSYSFPWL